MTGPEKGRLLVLDDDVDFGGTVCAMSAAVGFLARATVNAEEFYRLEAAWRPTHVAIDLIMSENDGMEIIHRLAGQGCHAAIIIISGAGDRVVDAAYRVSKEHGLNVLGSLSKPFPPSSLRKLLQQALTARAAAAGASAALQEVSAEAEAVTEIELQAGIDRRQIRAFYQPKIGCVSGALAGFEALARWQHPERGLIGPEAFIPLAESTGQVRELTFQIIDTAFGWLSSHFAQSNVLMSVNLSASSLSDLRFANQIFAASWDHGLDPRQIILEITETSAMSDPRTALDLLTRLRIKGFQLAIDDFGVGYSSMVQLARLPFSELKIDQSFVKNLSESDDSRKIVRGIVGLGHSLGMRVTAEGVEDDAALAYLRSVDCDLAHGFFIGKPMDGDAALAWTAETGR